MTNIAYEEWCNDLDADELEFLERQEKSQRGYKLNKLYDAVGTFEPYWEGNIHFFHVKAMQDAGLKSIWDR